MNPGVLEESGKAVGNVVDAMRSQPLAIALVIMNLGLLLFLFYYSSRITSRTETTAAALFQANDKLYAQWGAVVKDQGTLVEKAMHCILPEDALKLLQAPLQRPSAPAFPAPLPNRLQDIQLPLSPLKLLSPEHKPNE
jgi:hypothetical protein